MKYKVALLIVAVYFFSIVFAESNSWLHYYTGKGWFSIESAEKTSLPEGLTEREAEIYRAGYANGHYDALHPEYIPGLYVINTKTKKFHLSNCMNTLQIATENRKHSYQTPQELQDQDYSPCGQCHPEREMP